MSVQYILDNTYSYVRNSKLNQALEVSTSVKAPVHYVDTLSLQKNLAGNLEITAPVVECTQIEAPIGVIDTVNVQELIPSSGSGGQIAVDGKLRAGGDFSFSQPYPANYEGVTNFNGSVAALVAQNKSAGNLASSNVYLCSNDSDGNSKYGVLGLNNTSYNPNSNTIDSQPNSLYLSSTNGDVSIIGNYLAGGSVHLGYDGATKAVSVMNSGAISLGTTYNPLTQAFVYNAGNSGQVLKSAGAGAPAYWDLDQNDVADWASYPAIGSVDMDTNNIDNAASITALQYNLTVAPNVEYQQYGGKSVIAPAEDSQIFNPQAKYGYYTFANSANVEIESDGKFTAPNGTVSAKYINTADGSTLLVNQVANSITSTSSANLSGFGNVSCVQVKPSYVPAKNWYVSTNGDNANPGNENAPFLTIAKALTSAAAGDYINIMGGSYNETLTISKAVFLRGMNTSADGNIANACQIVGDITVSVTTQVDNMFNTLVSFDGLFINGMIESNSGSTVDHVIQLNNCYMYQESGSGRMIHVNPSTTDCRLWVQNTKIINKSSGATSPLVEIDLGMLKMVQVDVTTYGLNSCLKFGGSGRCDVVSLSSFTSASSLSNVVPVVDLNSSTTNPYAFGNCAFIYSSSTDKSGNINACGIRTTSTSFVITLYCTFSLAGTTVYGGGTGNYVIRDPNSANPLTCSNFLFFSNNAGWNVSVGMGGLVYVEQANTIEGVLNTNKRSLQAVA